MKLIIAIVRDTATEAISAALNSASLKVTHIASTGSFLRHGNSTLLIGVEDGDVDKALGILREKASSSTETEEKHAVIFVLNVDQYVHF